MNLKRIEKKSDLAARFEIKCQCCKETAYWNEAVNQGWLTDSDEFLTYYCSLCGKEKEEE